MARSSPASSTVGAGAGVGTLPSVPRHLCASPDRASAKGLLTAFTRRGARLTCHSTRWRRTSGTSRDTERRPWRLGTAPGSPPGEGTTHEDRVPAAQRVRHRRHGAHHSLNLAAASPSTAATRWRSCRCRGTGELVRRRPARRARAAGGHAGRQPDTGSPRSEARPGLPGRREAARAVHAAARPAGPRLPDGALRRGRRRRHRPGLNVYLALWGLRRALRIAQGSTCGTTRTARSCAPSSPRHYRSLGRGRHDDGGRRGRVPRGCRCRGCVLAVPEHRAAVGGAAVGRHVEDHRGGGGGSRQALRPAPWRRLRRGLREGTGPERNRRSTAAGRRSSDCGIWSAARADRAGPASWARCRRSSRSPAGPARGERLGRGVLSMTLVRRRCAAVPVISTDAPPPAEIITDGADGRLVPAGDRARPAAEAMVDLIEDGPGRRSMWPRRPWRRRTATTRSRSSRTTARFFHPTPRLATPSYDVATVPRSGPASWARRKVRSARAAWAGPTSDTR